MIRQRKLGEEEKWVSEKIFRDENENKLSAERKIFSF